MCSNDAISIKNCQRENFQMAIAEPFFLLSTVTKYDYCYNNIAVAKTKYTFRWAHVYCETHPTQTVFFLAVLIRHSKAKHKYSE